MINQPYFFFWCLASGRFLLFLPGQLIFFCRTGIEFTCSILLCSYISTHMCVCVCTSSAEVVSIAFQHTHTHMCVSSALLTVRALGCSKRRQWFSLCVFCCRLNASRSDLFFSFAMSRNGKLLLIVVIATAIHSSLRRRLGYLSVGQLLSRSRMRLTQLNPHNVCVCVCLHSLHHYFLIYLYTSTHTLKPTLHPFLFACLPFHCVPSESVLLFI